MAAPIGPRKDELGYRWPVSWETVEEWPDGRSGGVFRGAAEVIVARRGAPSALDRLRLWWHSTPDHPFGALPHRVALTPSWLYVETRGGKRQRARVEQIMGRRYEAGRVIYAVADGEDLVLVHRRADPLEKALDERSKGDDDFWRSGSAWIGVIGFALLMLAISLAFTLRYHDGAIRRIRDGLITSESALGLYTGLGGVLLTLLFITFFPQRWLVDSMGMTSVRGLFGWVRGTIPPERVRRVDLLISDSPSQNPRSLFYSVEVATSSPAATQRIFVGKAVKPAERAAAKREAEVLAHRVGRIFDVEVRDLTGRTR